jgi:hypothetical protein
MGESYEPPLNEFGLFIHHKARSTIGAFVRVGLATTYPLYLVGMVLPEHCGGPAVVRLLTLPDGGVLSVHARSLRRKKRVVGSLPYDVDFLEREEIERYSEVFYAECGGFGTSVTTMAEEMLNDAWLGVTFGREVAPSPLGPPAQFPSDWTDMAYYSQRAIGCVVEGFSPSADVLDRLEVSDALKRVMQIAPSGALVWLEEWGERLAAEVHPQVQPLVAEAWSIRLISPRASVALLRSVAELVVAALMGEASGNFHNKLQQLERRWQDDPPDSTPAGRREAAWREGVLSCLHTLRDIGNRIHADSVVGRGDLDLAHSSNRRLLEAVLRVGPLDPPLPR